MGKYIIRLPFLVSCLTIIGSLSLFFVQPSFDGVFMDLYRIQLGACQSEKIKNKIKLALKKEIVINWKLNDQKEQGCWVFLKIALESRSNEYNWLWKGVELLLTTKPGNKVKYRLTENGCIDIKLPFDSFPAYVSMPCLTDEVHGISINPTPLAGLSKNNLRRRLENIKDSGLNTEPDTLYYSELLYYYLERLLESNPDPQVKFNEVRKFVEVYDTYSVDCGQNKFLRLRTQLRKYLDYDEYFYNKEILNRINKSSCLRSWLRTDCN